MSFEDTVESMRRRMPWPVAQRVLASQSVERGQGWDRTVAKLLDPDADLGEEAEAELQQSLREHILCGEKLSRFFQVSQAQKAAIRDALIYAEISANQF